MDRLLDSHWTPQLKDGLDAGEEEKKSISSVVHQCVQEEQLLRLQRTVMKYKFAVRQAIVSSTVDGNAPLFTSCVNGSMSMARFLIDRCGADVEQTGVYQVPGEFVRHVVTPLWVAAVANHLNVVKLLLERGANINALSDTGSTPVRSACYMTNIEVVQYLVEHGANIHKPNFNGGTCLINSVQSPQLCEFLIEKGASINETDNSGNLPLHYAIREGHIPTVVLLLNKGCDYWMTNKMGDDALQCAGLRGQVEVVEIIRGVAKAQAKKEIPLEKLIDTWELLGCNAIDERQNMQEGLAMWKKAMEMRFSQNPPLLKVLPSETHGAFQHTREANSMEELQNLHNQDTIFMHSLLTKIRIVGLVHKDTTFAMMYRGAVYADMHQFQMCVELWKFALVMRYKIRDDHKIECLFTVQALIKILWEMQILHDGDANSDPVIPSDLLQVLEVMVGLLQELKEMTPKDNCTPRARPTSVLGVSPREDIVRMMQFCLHMVHLGVCLEEKDWLGKKQSHELRCLLYQLVQLNPTTKEGQTLVHLAADPNLHSVGGEFYSPLPSVKVIKLLLECGADVNARDFSGNTPLHVCQSMKLGDRGAEIPVYLLNEGAHADVAAKDGSNPLESLQKAGFHLNPVQYISLKCLCAQIIRKKKVPFQGELPNCLVDFVKLH